MWAVGRMARCMHRVVPVKGFVFCWNHVHFLQRSLYRSPWGDETGGLFASAGCLRKWRLEVCLHWVRISSWWWWLQFEAGGRSEGRSGLQQQECEMWPTHVDCTVSCRVQSALCERVCRTLWRELKPSLK